MDKLFSWAAFIVAVSYSVLIVILLGALWNFSDFEGRSFGLLFIGFPWVLVFQSERFYILALIMNVATVYICTLSVVRLFGRNSR
jgi:hypothetical protein